MGKVETFITGTARAARDHWLSARHFGVKYQRPLTRLQTAEYFTLGLIYHVLDQLNPKHVLDLADSVVFPLETPIFLEGSLPIIRNVKVTPEGVKYESEPMMTTGSTGAVNGGNLLEFGKRMVKSLKGLARTTDKTFSKDLFNSLCPKLAGTGLRSTI